MLLTLGRGLSPASSGPARKTFDFTSALPSEFTYTRADTAATCRNASGKLVRASSNVPRFDHDASGLALGVLIEGSRQNKSILYNAAPTTTTGLTISSGTPTISIVTDATELTAAGLDQIGNGNVFKIDAGGADCEVNFDGQVGNTNAHSFSIWGRVSTGTAYLKRSGSGSPSTTITGSAYKRYKLENNTPSTTSDKLRIKVLAGGVFYGLLPQVEEAAFASSEIVTDGAAATRATDSLKVSSPNVLLAFDEKQGYILARYRPYVLTSSADQFVAAAHNGSSADTMGIRISKVDTSLQAWVRDDSVSMNVYDDDTAHVAGELQAAAISWKPGTSTTAHAGVLKITTYATDPSGFTELDFGHRNGAVDSLWGHVSRGEIGAAPLSGSNFGGRLYLPGDVLAIGGGQSLMVGHFNSQESGSAAGRAKFIETVAATRKDNVCVFINGATGSTAASKTSNPTSYWWDLATSTRGPAFDTFYNYIANAGFRPNVIFWAQGEEDSHHIGIDTSRQQYKDALNAIFADMRTTLGDIPIVIQRIGRRGSFATTGGVQTVREVQKEIIAANSWCHDGPEIYDQPLFDQVHLTDAGYVVVAQRDARKFLSVLGESVSGVDGPRIVSASRSGTSVTVTLAHDAGTDFTPTSGISGFRFFDDASEITISAAVRTNATTITLTLASAPTGSVKTLYYGYDAMLTINTANIVKDNAAISMPLRTATVSVN